VNDFPEFRIVPFTEDLIDDQLYLLKKCFELQHFTPERVRKFFGKGYGHRNYTFLAYWGDKVIGHYSLNTFPLYYKGKTIKGGSPEFECIDRDFIVKCAREGIDYRNLNPVSRLHDEVKRAAREEGVVLLSHFFPSESAVATMRKSGYVNETVKIRYYFWVKEEFRTLISRHCIHQTGALQKIRSRLVKLSGPLYRKKYRFVKDEGAALVALEKSWIEKRDRTGVSFDHSADFLGKLFSSDEYLKLIVRDDRNREIGPIVALKEGKIVRVLLWSLPEGSEGPVFRSMAYHLGNDKSFLPEGFEHIEVLDVKGRGGLRESSMLLNGFLINEKNEDFSYLLDEDFFGKRELDIHRDLALSVIFSDRTFDFS
jgi:hypothetical protein